jgi:hypothetical protein
MGSGGNAAGSGATPGGTFACNYGPQFIEGKPTRAQGRPRPEHRKRRASNAPSASGNRYREQRTLAGSCTGRQPGSRVRAHGNSCVRCRGGDMSTPQKCPPTRHYLQTTSDNRRSGRQPAMSMSASTASGTGISARRCAARRGSRPLRLVLVPAGVVGQDFVAQRDAFRADVDTRPGHQP